MDRRTGRPAFPSLASAPAPAPYLMRQALNITANLTRERPAVFPELKLIFVTNSGLQFFLCKMRPFLPPRFPSQWNLEL